MNDYSMLKIINGKPFNASSKENHKGHDYKFNRFNPDITDKSRAYFLDCLDNPIDGNIEVESAWFENRIIRFI